MHDHRSGAEHSGIWISAPGIAPRAARSSDPDTSPYYLGGRATMRPQRARSRRSFTRARRAHTAGRRRPAMRRSPRSAHAPPGDDGSGEPGPGESTGHATSAVGR